MSRNSSTIGRLKGIFLRGKRFWYRYSHEGRQYRLPLDTEDEREAITKALRIRANPLLAGAEPLGDEIKSYLEAKQDEGTSTRNSADSRGPVLDRWVGERRLKEVREIHEDEIKSWLVEKKKLCENPAEFIKAKISNSVKRRRFCRREQVDHLIGECPDREMKFTLYAGFHAGLRKGEIVQALRDVRQ